MMTIMSIISMMIMTIMTKTCEESQVMAAHWSIALNDESLLTQSHVGIKLLGQLKRAKVFG